MPEPPAAVTVFDPFAIGHHPHRLRFMVSALGSRARRTRVLGYGNTRATPEYQGLDWAQQRIGPIPPRLFMRALRAAVAQLRAHRGRRVLLVASFDNLWYYFAAGAALIGPYLRAHGIELMGLQFRAGYLQTISRRSDAAKAAAFGLLRRSMPGFVLLTTFERYEDHARRVAYLPDILDAPAQLPDQAASRDALAMRGEDRLLLLFGNLDDPRKGFGLIERRLASLPDGWGLLVIQPGSPQLRRRLAEHPRARVVEGPVDHARKIAMFRASDAVLLPYPVSFHGSSGALMDAVVYERPIVTTGFPFAREMLGQHRIGVEVDFGLEDCWAQALPAVAAGRFAQPIAQCKAEVMRRFDQAVERILG